MRHTTADTDSDCSVRMKTLDPETAVIPHTTASPYCFGRDSKCILTLGCVVFSGLGVQVSCSTVTVLPPQPPILINTHDSSREVNLRVILSDILFFDITL